MKLKSTQRYRRWMALDLGSKSIGIAISDPLRITARPLTTIHRISIDEDCRKILELAESQNVERIVVGKPLHLDGRQSTVLKSFIPIVERIKALADGVQIVWTEERLSSKESEILMAELGIPISERRKKRDEIAAALILQWYLEETASDR